MNKLAQPWMLNQFYKWRMSRVIWQWKLMVLFFSQGDDSVVECVNEGNKVGVHMSWNEGRTNIRHSTVSALKHFLITPNCKCRHARKMIRICCSTVTSLPENLISARPSHTYFFNIFFTMFLFSCRLIEWENHRCEMQRDSWLKKFLHADTLSPA